MLIIVFLIVASCIAFGRIAGNGFIDFDDKEYITNNNYIQSGINTKSVAWAFTTTYFANWHPLTWLSHMLDWNLFGSNASGHHLASLFLHIGAAVFLFLFLFKTTDNIWPAAFATAFFALHPLRVESVAWASERKDVLSMFFGMACLYAYAFYTESNKLSQYMTCLILFVLALMSKPMMVTLPFVFLLLDYWPLKRWGKKMDFHGKKLPSAGWLILEKIPFMGLTIVASIMTIWAQNKFGAVASTHVLSFSTRITNSIFSYTAYIQKIFWPNNLAIIYPYDFSLPSLKLSVSLMIIITITSAVLYYVRKMPFLFIGWFWYLGTLIPVIGLVQVGKQAMADRYTYLPSIGLAIMLSWSISSLMKNKRTINKILFPLAAGFLVIMSFLTWQQCGYWKNNIDLWNHALKATKNNHLAYYNRGEYYAMLGQYKLAIRDYDEGIRLQPDAEAYDRRGIFHGELGQYSQAIDDFNRAINIKPTYANAYYDRGLTYYKLSRHQLAINDYNRAIHFKPDFTEAYMNRGIAYFKQGNRVSGCSDAGKACALGNCETLKTARRIGLCH